MVGRIAALSAWASILAAVACGEGTAPATATQLAIVGQPAANQRVDLPFGTVVVALRDASGQLATSASSPVSITLDARPDGATLSGTLTITPYRGIAAFGDLAVNKAGSYTLRASSAGLAGATSQAFTASGPGRSAADREDDVEGPQIHVVYALPRNGAESWRDLDGSIEASVGSFHRWFTEKTNGLALRFDTFDGQLDVTYFRLDGTDAEVSATGAGVSHRVKTELLAAGRIRENKQYLVYYDGRSTFACGGAEWPGQVAVLYLLGAPPTGSCALPLASSSNQFPGYWEFAGLHDLLHTFGIVSPSAPNHFQAHVPEQNDLMYGASTPALGWIINSTTVIDVGGDDYFGTNVPAGVVNLSHSPFVIPVVAALIPKVRRPDPAVLARTEELLRRLPVHENLAPTHRRHD